MSSNVRGLSIPSRKVHVKKALKSHKPDVILLQEFKIANTRLQLSLQSSSPLDYPLSSTPLTLTIPTTLLLLSPFGTKPLDLKIKLVGYNGGMKLLSSKPPS